ncbi:MAG TPA: DUF5916 domain-containing protein [Patescibacteria group bacterium]|nr:DUF5916 domain-containing protein [Patescibacteria group bacterium]
MAHRGAWLLLLGLAAGIAAPAASAGPAAAGPAPPASAAACGEGCSCGDGRACVGAVRTTGAIVVDGRLDEPDWDRAGVIADLTQHAPHPGEPTPYRTEVRVLLDQENLYFGVHCFDPEPEKISLHSMQRDVADPFGDDFFLIVFDTFGDKRTGYLFEVHATGAVGDGLIPGPGIYSSDWDGIWDVRTRIDASGWTAEIRLPARTLHFKQDLQAWGFNVLRFIPRDRTNLHWSGYSIDSDVIDLSSAGLLSGIGGIDQGHGLTISPYALGRFESVPAESTETTTGRAGLDLSYSLTPGVTGVLTANTDFAETEVDTRQINLTRFDLFFPEKRPFFLDGSSLFEFGLGLGQDFVPFYSRRIGLVEVPEGAGNPAGVESVPIDWGAKILGHAGRLGIAALDIQTGDSIAAPGANLAAARVAYDVTDRLRVGALGTHGDPGGVLSNSLAGVDAVWHCSTIHGDKKMSIGGWAARSAGDLPPGRRDGWGFKVDYPNDFWEAYARAMEFGDALDPALGFLPRPGTRWYDVWNAIKPRPSRGGSLAWIRQAFFESGYRQVDNLDGRTESSRLFTSPFNIETESGEHFEADWVPTYEFVDPAAPPFEIAPGVVVTPGGYHFTRYHLEAQSAQGRKWQVGGGVSFGDFYGGRLTQTNAFVNWDVLRGRLHQSLDLENDFGYLPEGDFIQRLFQLQNVYAFSPRLLLFGFFQYDTDSQSLGMNARLRWTFHPGNDLFLVWNRNWSHPLGEGRFDLSPESDQVAMKVRFAWTR